MKPTCGLCFTGGEEKTKVLLRADYCAECGALCGPGTDSPEYHFPTGHPVEAPTRPRFRYPQILDLGLQLA